MTTGPTKSLDQASPETCRLMLDDCSLDVELLRRGGRKALILIHGVGVSGDYFKLLARELYRDYDVHIVTLPGYGKTPKPKKPYDIDQFAEIITQYTKRMVDSESVLLGQSMGCQIVSRAVVSHPDLFDKFILVGPTVNCRERTWILQALRLLQDSFREPPRLNLAIVRDYFRMGVGRFIKTVGYMLADHIEDYLPKVTISGLIIRGENDPIVPRRWTHELVGLSDNLEHHEVKGAPHVVQYKNYADLARVCRDFIN